MNILKKCFGSLCCRSFIIAFIGALLTILTFDVIWCAATSFHAFGLFSTYLYAVTLALLLALPGLLRHGRWLMLVLLALTDGLALSNIIYARTYFAPIPPISYMLAGTTANYGASIFSSMWVADALFPVITILTVWLMGSGPRDRKRRKEAWGGYGISIAVMTGICAIHSLVVGSPMTGIDRLKADSRYHSAPAVAYTLPVSVLHDYLRDIEPVLPERKTAVTSQLADFNRYKEERELADNTLTALNYTPRNVVLIILESFEAWPVGARVEGREITPNLNRFVADSTSWYARRVLSQVAHGRSMDGQLELTTGLMPLGEMSFPLRYAANAYPHLGKTLKTQRGTRNYLLASNAAWSWNSGAVTANFGFDERRYSDAWDASEKFEGPDNPTDGSFMRQIVDKMRAGEIWPVGQPAFIEILTFSSHTPFLIPEEHRSLHLKRKYPALLGDYITAINYTDAAVGRLVDYIRSRPDADSTMIVLIGDHEGLATWRRTVRNAGKEYADLVDAEPFVPMIILNAPHPGRREAVMGQVDVYPTILSQAGLRPDLSEPFSTDAFPGLGISALSPLSPPYAVELNGRIHGDTVGANPRVLRHVLDMPAASSTIIRGNMFRK